MFFGFVNSLDPAHPLVVSVARSVRLVKIDSALAYAAVKKRVTGEEDHAALGSLYLAKGWIEGPHVWERARQAYYQGALHGDAEATYAYAIMNLTGIGGAKDVPAAIVYLKRAADKGHRNAHWQLGNLYLSPALYNVNEATRWLARAFVLGDRRAFALLVLINPSRTRNA